MNVYVTHESIKRAMESEDADTLMALAKEHTSLIKEISNFDSKGMPLRIMYDPTTNEIYNEKINQVLRERDRILKKYE